MSPPDADTIKMARDDMKNDSRRWSEAADIMQDAYQQAANLSLTGFHFGYVPTIQGFTKNTVNFRIWQPDCFPRANGQ